MNTSEIDITALVNDTAFDPWNLSNSRANLGDNAGTLTWNASKAVARDTEPCPLPEASEDEFKDFVRSSGGWDDEEIAAWSHEELVALFVQWVAGDIQEAFGYNLDEDFNTWDWAQYEIDAEKGRVSSRLFRSEGKLYFSISN
jgi:hypothetical protein